MAEATKLHRYEGRGVTVTYDAKRCIHAAECVHGLPGVFDPDAKPWILTNLAQSLRAIGQDTEATEVSRVGLSLPFDHATRFHSLALASDACLRFDFVEAREDKD